jgi:hypothetical protein
MAYYAFLDEQNIVVEVIAGKDESNFDWESYYGAKRGLVCKRTSYNTMGGEHPNGTPFRKNYAGIGYTYDAGRDAFIPPQPFASWTLNEDSCLWNAPVAMPEDGQRYTWDEDTTAWVVVEAA